MNYRRLIYCSDSQPGLTFQNIEELASQSRRNNRGREIYGAMLYGQARFLQVLEGNSDEIALLYHKIEQDPRHSNLLVLEDRMVEEPMFAEWSMAIVFWEDAQTNDQVKELIIKTGSRAFIPHLWDARMALKILKGLAGSKLNTASG